MKKRISLLLVLMLFNGAVVFANGNGSIANFKATRQYKTNQFTDVFEASWYAESVKTAYELSLVNGTSNTTFSPNDNMTIAEAITLASRLNNIYYGNTYVFVGGDVWYQTYVDYAIKNGIIKANEYPNLNEYATRAQFARIFASALPDEALAEINRIADNSIPDVNMQSYAADSIYKLYRAGVLTGNDAKGTFTPTTNIQRSAVATIVSRMANVSLRQSIRLVDDTNTSTGVNSAKLTSEEISEKCAPAVFYIESYAFNGELSGSGSGFFITSNGIAITNYHVVANSIYIEATTNDGKVYKDVSIIDSDEANDLALLRISGWNFPYLRMGDSTHIQQGQQVYALGSPLGLSNTMSQGIISNVSRIIDNTEYMQISVPINHGSSGGALINQNGEVIGVTSAGFETTGDLNLAVPINCAKHFDLSSQEDYVIWAGECYPGFSQVLDFGYFSGVRCLSSYGTTISVEEEYDMDDFHPIGKYDAGDCFAQTIYLYVDALEINGMTVVEFSDSEAKLESDTETVYLTNDFSKRKILISAVKKPAFYKGFNHLLDFGWFSDIPRYGEPYYTNESVMYEYKWSDYYYTYEFVDILDNYFSIIEEQGFEYVREKTTGDGHYILFEGNGVSVVYILYDTTMYVDIANI